MKIHIFNDNKVLPFLYVDDWYSPEEEKLIWKELDFYTNPISMHRTEDSEEGELLTDEENSTDNESESN